MTPALLRGAALTALARDAERRYPRECCGLLLEEQAGGTSRLSYVPLENTSPSPHDRHEAGARDLLAALQRAERDSAVVRGLAHSHPRGPRGLSSVDREAAIAADGTPLWPGADLVVLSLDGGTADHVDVYGWSREERGYAHRFSLPAPR